MLGRGLRCGLSFQSTLPRRERQYNRIEAVTGFPFQSTLPRRERPCAATVPTSTPFNFNPRSREGSDTGRRRDRLRRGYFNPRSREGSDPPAAPQALQVRISIHAPAKGATSLGVYLSHGEIFQSTLPRRERPILPTQSASPLLFQSTLPRRERPDSFQHKPDTSLFQSTLPRRERLCSNTFSNVVPKFQSTLPRRERPLPHQRYTHGCDHFNPRSREGSDILSMPDKADALQISIHAPAKGATIIARARFHINTNFNPRSREGSDVMPCIMIYLVQHFNPRSREGSDEHDVQEYDMDAAISIHAPAKGATRLPRISRGRGTNFNPRSREGSDAAAR